MIRNLKTLGIALAAMFALSAVAASAASAQQGKLTSDGPVTLTGTQTGALMDNSFTGGAGDVTCTHTTYLGHKYNVTPHELIPNEATTATVTPIYTECQAHTFFGLITLPATVTMNGCDFVFHIGSTTEKEGTYGVTADLVCPENKKVEVEVYEGGTHTNHVGSIVCTIKVKGQTPTSDAHLTHTPGEPDDIDLKGTFTNIHEEYSGSACGAGATDEEAILHVDVTIKGHNSAGENTPVTITDAA